MVTTLEDMNVRGRLRAQRVVLALLFGVTCAGFYEDLAFYVVTLHAIIWLSLLIGKTATLRELELADAPTLHHNQREVVAMKKN